jgi:hypothetical protein
MNWEKRVEEEAWKKFGRKGIPFARGPDFNGLLVKE